MSSVDSSVLSASSMFANNIYKAILRQNVSCGSIQVNSINSRSIRPRLLRLDSIFYLCMFAENLWHIRSEPGSEFPLQYFGFKSRKVRSEVVFSRYSLDVIDKMLFLVSV